jgi:hypothetical protein
MNRRTLEEVVGCQCQLSVRDQRWLADRSEIRILGSAGIFSASRSLIIAISLLRGTYLPQLRIDTDNW